MLKPENYTTNELLNNDGFIAWVTSDNKTNDHYWSEIKKNLSEKEMSELREAEQIIKKIKHLKEQDVNLSDNFIKDQYIKLLESSSAFKSNKSIKPRVIKLRSLIKYAAAIVILFSLSVVLYNNIENEDTFREHLTACNFNTEDILLQVSENEYYKISDLTNNKWLTNNGEFVSATSGKMSFVASDHIVSGDAEYKLYVPSGKKYHLTLIDGTEVDLNSNSVITFNNSVISKKRNVSLTGEAFFDVAHNSERPFIVNASNSAVEVLGTEFNVSNYSNDDFVRVTLLEGSVKVSNRMGESKTIKPGELANVYVDNSIGVGRADVQKAVAWVSGKMIFNNDRLEDILPRMNRWFDVEFIIKDKEIEDYRFTGTIKKENNLIHYLQILEYTEGISYKIDNGKVILYINK